MQYHHPTPRALIKPGMVISLGLALLVPAVSFAADLTAEQIVTKVSQTYSGLRSFRFVGQLEGRKPAGTDGKVPITSGPVGFFQARYETDLTVSTPGKIRLFESSQAGELRLVSNGLETWVYIPKLSEYLEADAAPLLQELWANPIGFICNDLAWYRSLSLGARRAKLRGEETLSLGEQKVRCYVVVVPIPAGSRTVWVDEQRFIVLRDEWTSPSGTGGPYGSRPLDMGAWTSGLTKADLGPISDDAFQFAVPTGVHRVDSFNAPAGTVQRVEEVSAALLIGSEMEQASSDTQLLFLRGEGLGVGTVYALPGSKAHDFTATSLGGESVRLDSLHGKVVVLNFWASWCKPCQEELAVIQKLHEELASKGVVFLGIDDESVEIVKSFVQAGGYTFPMLLDSKQTVHGLYGVRLAPTTVVIDRKGKITGHLVGAASEAQLRQALTAAGLDTTKP